jgi:hypothetical protein
MTDDNGELDGNSRLYRVILVAGHPPVGLDDLIGATSVTVEHKGHEYRLIGTGVEHDQIVLFYQKETGSALDTGPVWTMTDHADGGLTARPPIPD